MEINEISTMKSLQFDLSTIRAATHNFSIDNKLGEGEFGEVYKVMFSLVQYLLYLIIEIYIHVIRCYRLREFIKFTMMMPVTVNNFTLGM